MSSKSPAFGSVLFSASSARNAMAAPSVAVRQRRGAFGLYELLQSWWRHRVSFLLSLSITLIALLLYILTFVGERPTPIFEFVQRLELATLDTRFRYRPQRFSHPDPRIVVIDIDQRAQEVLGRWPFSRTNFAKTLDVLHDDGAKVVGFDITFSKPDRSAAPIRALWAELEARRKRGEPVDAKLSAEVQRFAASFDADKQFATVIQRFGPVVLGNYFLFTDADLRGMEHFPLTGSHDGSRVPRPSGARHESDLWPAGNRRDSLRQSAASSSRRPRPDDDQLSGARQHVHALFHRRCSPENFPSRRFSRKNHFGWSHRYRNRRSSRHPLRRNKLPGSGDSRQCD